MTDMNKQHDDVDEEYILSNDVLDELSDEDAALYFSDPKAFLASREIVDETPADDDGDTDHQERPDDDQTPAETETDGDDATPAAGDDNEEWSNPFAADGIPDSLLIDKKTGQPYSNGLILGKYKTAQDYHDGMLHLQELVGRRETEKREQPPEIVPSQFVPPVAYTPEQQQQISRYALTRALTEHAQYFNDEGLDPNDYLDDITSLKAVNEALYYSVARRYGDWEQQAQQFVDGFTTTITQRDTLNQSASEQAFEQFVGRFVADTATEPDDDDREALRGAFDEVLTAVTSYDRQVQEYQTANPHANVYSQPDVQRFYAQYYTLVNGVPVLDPAKVARAAVDAKRDLLITAIRNTAQQAAGKKYVEALEQDASQTVRFPKTATTKSDDGVTGAHIPMWTLDELQAPDAWDRMVEAYGGDEEKAQRAMDRMYDHHDKAFQQNIQRAPVYDKANY